MANFMRKVNKNQQKKATAAKSKRSSIYSQEQIDSMKKVWEDIQKNVHIIEKYTTQFYSKYISEDYQLKIDTEKALKDENFLNDFAAFLCAIGIVDLPSSEIKMTLMYEKELMQTVAKEEFGIDIFEYLNYVETDLRERALGGFIQPFCILKNYIRLENEVVIDTEKNKLIKELFNSGYEMKLDYNRVYTAIIEDKEKRELFLRELESELRNKRIELGLEEKEEEIKYEPTNKSSIFYDLENNIKILKKDITQLYDIYKLLIKKYPIKDNGVKAVLLEDKDKESLEIAMKAIDSELLKEGIIPSFNVEEIEDPIVKEQVEKILNLKERIDIYL